MIFMSIKFMKATRIENNLADLKPVLKHNFYAVGTDGKKSYIINIDNATRVEANREATAWARKEGLRLEVVKAK